ncbi:hypothetical protein WSS_A15239 [Rhodococcus opacus M213]|uniref:Uncharacterized protein n=2 Tax=Rhodococcus opacus TaxID=37919 RepID=K8XJQ0_RHOOP|nr:hypothetical protein WSS_A15239 [Rhodococcus opacus M213]
MIYGDDNHDGYVDEDETGWDCNVNGNQVCGLVGDDNADGVIDEDESGWSCVAMGNRECGPVAWS